MLVWAHMRRRWTADGYQNHQIHLESADMLKPSVGFKFVPMFWYEMMGVNKIVGFILPDWIADIIPKIQFIVLMPPKTKI